MTYCWPFMSKPEITESLEWLTDVIRCRSAEQRLCLRPVPRQEFELTHFFATASQFGRARELAKLIGGDECYLPIWTDFTELGVIGTGTVTLPIDATETCYVDGGKLLLWQSDLEYEVCTISDIGTGTITVNPAVAGTYTNCLAAPVRLARFAQEFEAGRMPAQFVEEARARFVMTATEDLSAETGLVFPSYLTHSILTDRVAVAGSSSEQFTREVDTIDSLAGPIWTGAVNSKSIQTANVGWDLHSRADIWDLRVWLHTRKGRWKSFWVPSWNNDLTITADIGTEDTTIEISDIDYGSYYPSTCDFLIVTATAATPIRVTGHSAGDPGKEILTLSAAPGIPITVAEIQHTCRLVLSRFSVDRLDINHVGVDQAHVSAPVVEVYG